MAPSMRTASRLDGIKDSVKLDLATFVLDMVGIVDPSGAADAASAAISLWRGDWLGAGLSLLGVIGGIGDLAKIGKLKKYTETVEKAIALARIDEKFARAIRPYLTQLKGVFARLPMEYVPTDYKYLVQRIRYQIDNFIIEAPPGVGVLARASKEVVERCRNIDAARNKAIGWLESQGAVFGPHIKAIPNKMIGKRAGKEVGGGVASTKSPYWEIRLDFDPEKGPHYNVAFGKGESGKKVAFTFPPPPGTKPEEWISKLIQRLGDTARRPLPGD